MEILDLYDAEGVPLGRTIVRGNLPEAGVYMLLVHVCVFDGSNRMLIQQRQLSKKSYPGLWDVSAGGFVQSGEQSGPAACRELLEELGLARREEELHFVLREPFSCVLDDFYALRINLEREKLQLQESEISTVRFADREEIFRLQREEKFVDYNPALWDRLFHAAEDLPAV
ncbi:MAG: NUDIX domain-containing protein [Oscillospiraceae bacterium]|nr:NUDIX domain-containing protein [Oscillospiraceae bacterium]